METIERQGMTQEQKRELDVLSLCMRRYLERWHKQDGQRHSKTIIKFTGDRYRPTELDTHFRKGGKK